MPRYIDADKTVWSVTNNDKYGTITKEVFVSLLQNADTADVAPVVHAHWRYMHRSKRFGLYVGECSHCGSPNIAADYCGTCGAKMDEEVEDAKIYKHR